MKIFKLLDNKLDKPKEGDLYLNKAKNCFVPLSAAADDKEFERVYFFPDEHYARFIDIPDPISEVLAESIAREIAEYATDRDHNDYDDQVVFSKDLLLRRVAQPIMPEITSKLITQLNHTIEDLRQQLQKTMESSQTYLILNDEILQKGDQWANINNDDWETIPNTHLGEKANKESHNPFQFRRLVKNSELSKIACSNSEEGILAHWGKVENFDFLVKKTEPQTPRIDTLAEKIKDFKGSLSLRSIRGATTDDVDKILDMLDEVNKRVCEVNWKYKGMWKKYLESLSDEDILQ